MRRLAAGILGIALLTTGLAAPAAADQGGAPGILYPLDQAYERGVERSSLVWSSLDGTRKASWRVPDDAIPLEFSPDGRSLVYSIGGSGPDAGLYALGPDGRTVLLGPVPAAGAPVAWAPEGDRLIYVGEHNRGWHAYFVRRDGTGFELLAEGVRAVSWRPRTGSSLVLLDGRLVDVRDPAHPVEHGRFVHATWSSDGAWLAVTAEDDQRGSQVQLLDVAGDGSLPVDEDGRPRPDWQVEGGGASWSPDGTQLAVLLSHTGSTAILELHDRQLRELQGAGWGDWRWSPDGRRLAVWRSVREPDPFGGFRWFANVVVVDVADGRSRTVASFEQRMIDVPPLEWVDGRTLLLGRPSDRGGARSELRDVITGRAREAGTALSSAVTTAAALPAAWAATTGPRPTDQGCTDVRGGTRFPDLGDDNPHAAAISCVTGWDIARGGTDGRYRPAATVTRGQMATFIARTIERSGGTLTAPRSSPFHDVAGHAHQESIDKLGHAGVVRGVGDGRFAPDRPVTRDQMATFLAAAWAYRTGADLPAGAVTFTDVGGNFHRDRIAAVSAAGIAGGRSALSYAPGDPVRRDQMASFLARLLDALVAGGHAERPQPR